MFKNDPDAWKDLNEATKTVRRELGASATDQDFENAVQATLQVLLEERLWIARQRQEVILPMRGKRGRPSSQSAQPYRTSHGEDNSDGQMMVIMMVIASIVHPLSRIVSYE